MTTTTNKGYELQATGANAGTWGGVLNSDVFQVIDNNLGAITTKSLSSSNVTLSASESQSALLRLEGTLTANIVVTTDCVGFFIVENATSGSYSVSIRNSSISTAATVPQGTQAVLISDVANGVRVAGDSGFAAGTVMLFAQTTAPAGWTKSTSHNDKALRVVSGTASSGGTTAFSTCFAASRSLTGSVASHTLTTSEIPSHSHTSTQKYKSTNIGSTAVTRNFLFDGSSSNDGDQPTPVTTSTAGGGGGHAHTAGTLAVALAVQYVDVILATRD